MIFVVGNSRSGTTLMGRILGAHPQVNTFEELHFFENLITPAAILAPPTLAPGAARALVVRLLTTARGNIFARPDPAALGQAPDRILAEAGADPISLYRAVLRHETLRAGKAISCEQTPRYLFSITEIRAAFPEARFINMVRDPRDVMLSQKNKWRTYFHGSWNMPLAEAVRVWANYHPVLMAKLWSAAVRRGAAFGPAEGVLTVRFEDLLEAPQHTVAGICDFLGIAFHPPMLAAEDIGSSAKADRPGQRGLNPTASGRWRNGGLSARELAICHRLCAREMRAMGYDVAELRLSGLRYMAELPPLVVKGGLSLVLNLPRNRNVLGAIRRRFLQ
ncbi:sulfotransferase family protein [Phaeovulum sp.]|uniref:sulfotransferase family protein n=1 Tax=Phaeovulum sp. TaxID=2934796 RepID=UPI0039E554AA